MAGRPKRRGYEPTPAKIAWDLANKRPDATEQKRLCELISRGKTFKEAVKEVGCSLDGTWKERKVDPMFDLAIEEALTSWHDSRTRPFLEAFAGGISCAAACRESGVQNSYIQHRRRVDPVFAADYEAAYQDGADLLEDEARRRGVEGVDEPVFHRGEVVGTVRKYSDTLLLAMLKARRPDRYGTTRSKVEIDTALSPEELEAIRRLGADPDYAQALDKIAEGFSDRDGEE